MISPEEGLLWGATGGLLTAITGAYKDTTFEPFQIRKFWRSPTIAAIWGLVGSEIFPSNESKFLLLTFSIAMERVTTESWKALSGVEPAKFGWGTQLDKGWIQKKRIQP